MDIADPCRFVEHNLAIFWDIFWKKYQVGSTRDLENFGSLYKCVGIELDDLLEVAKDLVSPDDVSS
jgi:hypothetical protein